MIKSLKQFLCFGLTLLLFIENTSISYASTTVLPSQATDLQFQSMSLSASQGYVENIKLWTNDNVSKIILRTPLSFKQLVNTAENTQYQKAFQSQYKNEVVLCPINRRCMFYPMKLNKGTQNAFNQYKIFNLKSFNQYLLSYVNHDRRNLGLKSLVYDQSLQYGASIRATELAQYGHIEIDGISHVRINHARFSTAFSNIPNAIYKVGENTGMNFYRGNPYEVVSEKYMAEKFFKQWKASSAHYQNMMRPQYRKMAVGIKVSQFNRVESGHYSYFFGVQAFSK